MFKMTSFNFDHFLWEKIYIEKDFINEQIQLIAIVY